MRFTLSLLVAASCLLQWTVALPAETIPSTTRANSDPTITRSSPPLARTNSAPSLISTTPAPWSLACPQTPVLSCSATSASEKIDTCCTHDKGLVVLALQWMTTIGERTKWNVHGLWPDFCDGTFPLSSCDPSRNTNDVSKHMTPELVDRLNKFWISFKGDNPAFWSYEWNKHGTCMSTLEPRCHNPATYKQGQEIQPYFEKTASLYEQHDVYKALEKAGITPQPFSSGKMYLRQDVIDAVKKEFGVIPQLNCTKSGNGELDHLNLMFKVQGRDTYVLVDNFLDGNCPEQVKYPLKYDSTRPPPPPPKPKTPPTVAPTTPAPPASGKAESGSMFGKFFSGLWGSNKSTPPPPPPPTPAPAPSPSSPTVWQKVNNWWSGRSAVEKP